MFSHRLTHERGVPVLALVGEIDMAAEVDLQAALNAAFAEGAAALVVELGGVSFFDSAGLHQLDTLARAARERSTAVLLAAADENLLRLLKITGLDARFTVYPAVSDAVSAALARG